MRLFVVVVEYFLCSLLLVLSDGSVHSRLVNYIFEFDEKNIELQILFYGRYCMIHLLYYLNSKHKASNGRCRIFV